MPARRELVRVRGRDRDGCVVVDRRRRYARRANEPADRPKAADDGRCGVVQDERMRIARGRTQWCRVRVPGGRAVAHRHRPSDRSGSTRPACASAGGAFSFHPSAEHECTSNVMKPLFDNRWSGKKHAALVVHAPPWSAVGRRDMVQWAEDSRDSRCSAHPLSRRAAGALHRTLAALRRARGAALTSRRRVSPALPATSGAHGRWPRATGHRSSTVIHRARRRRTSTHGPRGRDGADTRRRDAGANPAGPGSTSHL